MIGAPYGNRTRVSAVKGRCPGPLDEGRSVTTNTDTQSGRHIETFAPSSKQADRFTEAFRRDSPPSVGAGSPLPAVRHRDPRFLRRQWRTLLPQLDRMLIGRTHEGHIAVARWAIDRHAGFHQFLTERVDVVHLVGEVTEIACFAVIFAVPVVGQLD